MSPRRRLRTRYEKIEPAEPEPAEEPAPAPPSPPPELPVVVAKEPASSNGDAVLTPTPEPTPREIPSSAPAPPVAAAAPGAAAPSARDPDRPRKRHRLGTLLFLGGLGGAAFLLGLIVFNNLVMPRLIHGISQVRVPDLTNSTLPQAEQALRPLNLQISRAGERFDPAVPRGFILSQDPPPGTAVRGRKRVSVVVSLGEEFSSVPELFGESQRSAEQLLKSAGLRLGVPTRAPSEEVGEGLIAGSDPGPESVLPRDTPVSLLISTGAGEESFVMPDVLGRELSGVRRQLEALGFRVVTPAGGAVGTIVAQVPDPGARITRNSVVQLQGVGRVIR
jgi:beta-lactam-binding protein with PASTA domain